jgi:deoxyribodipyrimidine photo-lyase
MIQSLKDLKSKLNDKLYFFYGNDIEILNKLLTKFQINTIAFNSDYTPFARQRDQIISKWCSEKNISLITSSNDYNLLPFEDMYNNTNKPYEMFTPFYTKLINNIKNIQEPIINKFMNNNILYDQKINFIIKDIDQYYHHNPNKNLNVQGGRDNALKMIKLIDNKYEKYRDFPAADKTTKLSAYIKFGCISIREIFFMIKKKYGSKSTLLRELIWREFYSHITYNFPRVLQGQIHGRNLAFKQKYDNLPWGYDENYFHIFCQAKTGYPMVDAGIRQMLSTGFMHNRCRMIVASFLTKDLLIDWKLGEQFFAQNLIDYDPASNSGGWQWCSSTGVDSQPYFRIFNPFLQSEKFDKDCIYIKKWIPELKDIPNKSIHNWNEDYNLYPGIYYKPIVNHKIQSEKAIKMFELK